MHPIGGLTVARGDVRRIHLVFNQRCHAHHHDAVDVDERRELFVEDTQVLLIEEVPHRILLAHVCNAQVGPGRRNLAVRAVFPPEPEHHRQVTIGQLAHPHVARAQHDQDTATTTTNTAETTSSPSTDFGFVKGLLAAGALARATRADGSQGLLDGIARAGTRRLAGSGAEEEEEAAATAARAGEGDGDNGDGGGGGGGNLLANALLLNRLRANLRDDGAEVRIKRTHTGGGELRLTPNVGIIKITKQYNIASKQKVVA